MVVVIAGGSGLLGRALSKRLLAEGHTVTVLSRRNSAPPVGSRGPTTVAWNPDGSTGPWARALEGADAVVNLGGAGIADRRWTIARKAILRSSRILSTRSLVEAIRTLPRRPSVFVQGSAVGRYGSSLDDRPIDESAPAGNDFAGRMAVDWETEAAPVEPLGCRLAVVRTGFVLTTAGGALPPLVLPFKLFVGGPMASGRQMMSWIHIDDWTSLVTWLLTTPSASGVFNGTAPHPVTNAEFARTLGRVLGRPSWFPVPAFVLRIVVGEVAEGLIFGQSVVPRRALDAGFSFAYPHLDGALRDVLARKV